MTDEKKGLGRRYHISVDFYVPSEDRRNLSCDVCGAPIVHDCDIELSESSGNQYGGSGETWQAELCGACFREFVITPVNDARQRRGRPAIEFREFDW